MEYDYVILLLYSRCYHGGGYLNDSTVNLCEPQKGLSTPTTTVTE